MVTLGSPRLTRVHEELRMIGIMALGLAACCVAWALLARITSTDLHIGPSAVAALVGAVLGAVFIVPFAVRRVRNSERHDLVPPDVFFETRAAASVRRGRLAAVVVIAPVVLLALDRVIRDGGAEMAGMVAGWFLVVGLCALWEARIWSARERDEQRHLFVLVRPQALMAHMGTCDIYQRGPDEPETPSPFDLDP